jgi:hypothetical protein
VTPPLAAYVKMRRYTGAMDTVFDCIELVEHLHLSKAVREHTTVSRLRLMANNCVCWANDLFSVDKELLEHNTHNLVFVLRQEYGLTLAEAMEQAVTMHDAEIRAFEWSPREYRRLAGKWTRRSASTWQVYVRGCAGTSPGRTRPRVTRAV